MTWRLTCLICGETDESFPSSTSRGGLVAMQEHLMDDHFIPREWLRNQRRFPPHPTESPSYEWALPLPDGRRWLRAEQREDSHVGDTHKSGERPGATEAEAAMTSLLYKLLTYAQQQAPYEDRRLTEQEECTLLTGGWIAHFELYPPSPQAGAPPLERAITWTMPDGRKFKIAVKDITE